MLEYYCDECKLRFESLEESPFPETKACEYCGSEADKCISAPKIKPCYWSVSQGPREPPANPDWMDTRPLADGMSRSEWKKKRRKIHFEARQRQIAANI